jgi:hypothetical protein
MRLLVCAITALIAMAAVAQQAAAPKYLPPRPSSDEYRKLRELESRARELEPRRRDTPLRELNLSDNEVREIQGVASRYAMNSMLNSSPVTTGCACEVGPLCTALVYVVATTPDKTVGLQLSRVRNAWIVGPVQTWWFRFAALHRRMAKMDAPDFFQARDSLLHEFPMCVGNDPVPDTKTAQTK